MYEYAYLERNIACYCNVSVLLEAKNSPKTVNVTLFLTMVTIYICFYVVTDIKNGLFKNRKVVLRKTRFTIFIYSVTNKGRNVMLYPQLVLTDKCNLQYK